MKRQHDDFRNNVFSHQEWSAESITNPQVLREKLDSYALPGRRIKSLKLIGLSYNLRREWIEEAAYSSLTHLDDEEYEDERQFLSTYKNIDRSMVLSRWAEADEPLLIAFDDGCVFEIDTPWESEFKVGMNCIPYGIDAGTNNPNLDANVLFSGCVGKMVLGVEINTRTTATEPISGDPYLPLGTKREVITNVILRLEGGTGLKIEGWYDFCHIYQVDQTNDVQDITLAELEPGLYNWEDLYIDELAGFTTSDTKIFFGDKGAQRVEQTFMTFHPQHHETVLHICVFDFKPFDLAISCWSNNCFDEFGRYEFSQKEWLKMLEICDNVLGCDSLEELAAYITKQEFFIGKRGNEAIQSYMRNEAKDLLDNEAEYRKRLENVMEWSRLVLGTDDTMFLYGF